MRTISRLLIHQTLLVVATFFGYGTAFAGLLPRLVSGDILFQNSHSGQSEAVMKVTQSRFSHCGIYMVINGMEMVIECAEGSNPRRFDKWISRDGGRYLAMRLKLYPQGLPASMAEKLKTAGERYGQQPYDRKFLWGNDESYCSELVWKAYDVLGVELCKLQHFRDFPIDREPAKSELKRRFGSRQIPRNEPVVSPQAIVDSDKLFVVRDTTRQ